ncbi:MAG: transcriptional regulator, partial [Methanobacteriota archaeon]
SVSFDFVARRDDVLVLVKVLSNVDSLSLPVATETRFLARMLDGHPLIVGTRSSSGDLDRGAVYLRHGIPVLSYETFEDWVLEGLPPLVYAAPGGFYVNVDGATLRRIREERGLSLGALAEAAGVSRRAISMYEEGMGAMVEVVERLEAFLDAPLATPFDPLSLVPEKVAAVDRPAPGEAPLDALEREVYRFLEGLGYEVTQTSRSPFNAISRRKRALFLTGVSEVDADLVRKARLVQSISSVIERPGVFFLKTRKSRVEIEGTPVIDRDDLVRLREPEDVVDLIRDRRRTA